MSRQRRKPGSCSNSTGSCTSHQIKRSLTMKRKAGKHDDLCVVWRVASSEPGWLRRLWLTGQYTEDELCKLEEIDDEFLRLAREEEAKHREWLQDLSKTDWIVVFPEAKRLVKRLSKSGRRFKEQLEVARDVDIEEVIGEYVELRRGGMYRLVGLCPFHEEKTPSFTVYTNDGHYYCFGCQEHGDVIRFISKIENLTFKQAVRVLYKHSQQD